jgi:hypothetical protein
MDDSSNEHQENNEAKDPLKYYRVLERAPPKKEKKVQSATKKRLFPETVAHVYAFSSFSRVPVLLQ